MPWWFPVVMILLAALSFGMAAWCYRKRAAIRAEAERSRSWPIVKGTITASYIGKVSRDAGEIGTTEIEVACLRYGYSVNGKDYQCDRIGAGGYLEGKRKLLDAFLAEHPVGKSVPVSYDPQDPGKAVLRPGETGGDTTQYLFATVALAVVGILTLCGLIYAAVKS
jgi:hypothetical protein